VASCLEAQARRWVSRLGVFARTSRISLCPPKSHRQNLFLAPVFSRTTTTPIEWFHKTVLIIFLSSLGLCRDALCSPSPLTPHHHGLNKVIEQQVPIQKNSPLRSCQSKDLLCKRIHKLLLNHYHAQTSDPLHIEKDLVELAHYFSQYPDAATLLISLEQANWQFQYKANMFQTIVSGSRLSVDSATIYFDTRAASRLKFHPKCQGKWRICVASPADAFLHELLHAQRALLTPSDFLAEGGLNNLLYPYEHERNIIKKENYLYQSMSRFDGLMRPIRKNHVGRYRQVACVTCVN
jgi:hypothetical protein